MSTVLDILSLGALWLVAACVLGVWVGRWLAWGSGEWLLDEWSRED